MKDSYKRLIVLFVVVVGAGTLLANQLLREVGGELFHWDTLEKINADQIDINKLDKISNGLKQVTSNPKQNLVVEVDLLKIRRQRDYIIRDQTYTLYKGEPTTYILTNAGGEIVQYSGPLTIRKEKEANPTLQLVDLFFSKE